MCSRFTQNFAWAELRALLRDRRQRRFAARSQRRWLEFAEGDYARMVEDGLLLEDAEPFEALMAHGVDIAARANGAAA